MFVDNLYVVGGQQRSDRPLFSDDTNWYEYRKGVILKINIKNGSVEKCTEYVTPKKARGEGDPILFKSGTIENNTLYICTQTEILIYALPKFSLLEYISIPRFNDLHHVRPTPDGNLLVANSGLEMVLEISQKGRVIREWNVLGEDPWEKYSKEIDYRKSVNLKPHRAHPNYVFYVNEDIWTTRFEKKDALCLTRPNKCVEIGIERVHDGFTHEGFLYFTTTNGYLVVVNLDTLQIEKTINLNEMHPENSLLGWCRGLFLDSDKAWVGFSRIRPTKFREAVSWVRQGFNQALPSHIACYDLNRKCCIAEINVEDYGLNAVFSILPAQ